MGVTAPGATQLLPSGPAGSWRNKFSNQTYTLPLDLSYTFSQTNGEVMFGLAPVGGNVVADNWTSVAFGFYHLNNSSFTRYNNTIGSQISTTANKSHRITISTAGVLTLYIDGASVYTQSGLPTTAYRLYAANKTSISLNDIVLRASNQPAECLNDTDGDGIPNSQDPDSDGDGCSDAFEAGATTNLTTDYTFPGPYGSNGLENSLETGTESGVVNYYTTYSNATNASVSNCTDTDGDGIADMDDIDDDNDGETYQVQTSVS